MTGLLGKAFKKRRLVIHEFLENVSEERIKAIKCEIESSGMATVEVEGEVFSLEDDQLRFQPPPFVNPDTSHDTGE